jgi:hypothetical protein
MLEAVHIWVTRERGALLQRVRTKRLLSRVLRTWTASVNHIRVDLYGNHVPHFTASCCSLDFPSGKATSYREASDANVASSALGQWKNSLAAIRNSVTSADAFAARSSLKSTLSTWKQRYSNRVIDERKADVARGFFVERRYFGQWIHRADQRKKERWVERRKKGAVRKAFHRTYSLRGV